jgi:hypothetical protein
MVYWIKSAQATFVLLLMHLHLHRESVMIVQLYAPNILIKITNISMLYI